ncbi:hypothetical protein F4811DRAFT_74214 [Daldinia bambusicola]|nr:hypothetical protein F4811DRAFT_74214 [Daldinia bambusicola]
MRVLYPEKFNKIPHFIRTSILDSSWKLQQWVTERPKAHWKHICSYYYELVNPNSITALISLLYHIFIFILSITVVGPIFWILFIPFFTIFEILRSQFVDIWRTYMIVLSLSIQTFTLRTDVSMSGVLKGSEDSWGYGQVLPLLLLISPLMSSWELFTSKS